MHCLIRQASRNLVAIAKKYKSPQLAYQRYYSFKLAMQPAAKVSECISKTYDNIVKSESDKNDYRGLELTNGLKVLLISDPTADKSAAAIGVRVGYLTDPWEFPGLAHFCEHMLFLGTKKFPDENDYAKYITSHSGMNNAYTAGDHTVYYFDIAPDSLEPAFDRFAQFFLGPLFTESATGRELNAIESENEKNLQNDQWRVHQLEGSLSRPGHDYTKFGTGNKKTLDVIPKSKGLDVRNALLDFHGKNYSSNIMTCVVLGRENLDTLTNLTVPFLAEIPNKSITAQTWPVHPYGPDQLKNAVRVVPVKDIRSMTMQFPIPDTRHLYKYNPGNYLGHLIGHEGPGSLLSELKAKGWANALSGGPTDGARGFSFFNISVELTEEGLEHANDIATLAFQYIKLLNTEGPQQRIFNEIRDLGQISFRFKGKEKPSSYVMQLIDLIPDYPFEELLTVPYVVQEFSPQHITDMVKLLTPENMRMVVVSKKFQGKTDKKEQWYGTDYAVEQISPDLIKQWQNVGLNPAFQLPGENSFIPESFELSKPEPEYNNLPTLIQNNEKSRLWFVQDKEYNLPKAVLQFDFRNPLAYHDPHYANMTHMFSALFIDILTEYSYDANLAGLRYSLQNSTHGVQLSISGYDNKQAVLLDKIVEKMVTFQVDPKRFDLLKEKYVRRLQNFQADQPYQHGIHYTSHILSQKFWSPEELLKEVDLLTADALQSFIPKLLGRLHLEVLAHGNLQKAKADSLLAMVEERLEKQAKIRPLLPSETVIFREHKLPDGKEFYFNHINSIQPTSSVHITYQIGTQSTRSNSLLNLFAQICMEPCFDELRTKQQLGYIVSSGPRRSSGTNGFRIIVQSDRSPQYVDGRVEEFLVTLGNLIKDMKDEEFETQKKSLIVVTLERPKKLHMLAARYWNEITAQQYCFDRANMEVEEIKKLTKEDVMDFFNTYIAKGATERKKLSVHVMPPGMVEQNKKDVADVNKSMMEITNVVEFKKSLALYPLAKPYIDVTISNAKL